MQAVVLVGGRGERLHPLTQTTPKPLIPLANRPLIEHIVRWLAWSGIQEVLLLTQYRASAFDEWLCSWSGIPVYTIEEPIALGTAGAVANVVGRLHGTTAVINGDNITNVDLRAMLAAHRRSGAIATIAVDHVEDVTGRGVVVAGQEGRVTQFQEKPVPRLALATTVNTGTYLIEPAALGGLTAGQPAMWETDVFPRLIAAGAGVYAFAQPHVWLDAGTVAGYFAAEQAILSRTISAPGGSLADGIWSAANATRATGVTLLPPVALGAESVLAENVRIEGPASIGACCRIEAQARIQQSAIWDGCTIGPGAIVGGSIIGYNCTIAGDAQIEGALLGDGVSVRAGARITSGSRIEPMSVVA